MASESGVSTGGDDHTPLTSEGHARTPSDGRPDSRRSQLSNEDGAAGDGAAPVMGEGVMGSEEEDTAGEGCETFPPDSSSTATDAVTDPLEPPIDFIETRPRGHAPSHCFNGAIGHSKGVFPAPPSSVHYENWSILMEMEESSKRGRSMKRLKPSRSVKADRYRNPYPLPRPPGKNKPPHPRPSPSSRKRRLSGRLVRPAQHSNASEEGDMAQADEMGEGEGRDDGFVEGVDPIGRRRNKKRAGGIHMLLSHPGGGSSPPSSPSNTPATRRRTSSRKSRLKPRLKKQSKPQLASADISTQESTTQGPGSSESSDEATSPDDGGTPLRTADDLLESCEEECEESRSLTPNLKEPSNSASKLSGNGFLGNLDHVSDIHPTHNPASMLDGPASKDRLRSNSDDNLMLDSNETSDTDLRVPGPSKEECWVSRRLESDLSTAPFSSETSDMDTSGNERAMAADSHDLNGVHSPPLGKRVQVKGGEGRGGVKGGDGHAHSGSSGEEILSRKKYLKKPISGSLIPAKPSPPVPRKATVEPHPQPPSAVAKKPISHTKSNPLSNKIITPSPQAGRPHPPGTHLPTRSLSSKGNLRVKPPVGTKPTTKPLPAKPTPPPKPQAKIGGASVGGGGGVGGACKPLPKPPANHLQYSKSVSTQKSRVAALASERSNVAGQSVAKLRSQSSVAEQSSLSQAGPVNKPGSSAGDKTKGKMKKAQSIEHSDSQVTTTKPLPRKPLKSTSEKVESSVGVKSSTPGVNSSTNPPVPPAKPAVPSKPRRISSEKRPNLIKPQASVPAVQARPRNENLMKRIISSPSPFVSDSSKNPSSSELSGQSQSPSISPYPSPAFPKRVPPTPPSKANKPISKRPSAPSLLTNSTDPKPSDGLMKRPSAPAISSGLKPSEISKTPSAPSISSSLKPSEISKTPSAPSLTNSDSGTDKTISINSSTVSNASTITFSTANATTTNISPSPSPEQTKLADSATPSPSNLTAISEVSLSDTVGSPSPPPIPHRGYMVSEQETSLTSPSTLHSSSSSSVPSPSLTAAGDGKSASAVPLPSLTAPGEGKLSPKTKRALQNVPTSPPPRFPRTKPRRPPPSPPNIPPATSSVAQPTSNVPTGEGGRRSSSTPSQPVETSTTSLPTSTSSLASSSTTTAVGSHYETESAGERKESAGERKEGYFQAHQSRETVEDVSYAIVKRSSLPRKSSDTTDGRTVGVNSPTPARPGKSSPTQQRQVTDTYSQPIGRTQRKLSSTRRTPPRSPKATRDNTYESIDELSKKLTRQATDRSHNLLTHKKSFSPPPTMQEDTDEPPPLPSRPAPSRQSRLSMPSSRAQLTNSSSSPNLLEPSSYEGLVLVKDQDAHPLLPKTREPVYDIIPEHIRKKPAPRSNRNYEEIILPDFEGEMPRLWVPPEREKEKEREEKKDEGRSSNYEKPSQVTEKKVPSPSLTAKDYAPSISLVASKEPVVSRLASSNPHTTLSLEDLRENWTSSTSVAVVDTPLSPLMRKRQAKSFSSRKRQSLMYKRMSSDRMRRIRANTLEPTTKNKRIIRSSSLDHLDDRMERSTRNSMHHTASSDSEDEEDEPTMSPTDTALPKIPSSDHLYRVPRSHRKPAGPFLCPPDVEPLYQYINTAEFLREPGEGASPRPQGAEDPSSPSSPSALPPTGKKQNQLELARQLSLRRLWCELPEVIESGVLDTLTPEERKLQEAMFEVISSEDSYLRSLDVLINHFMDDPGMNPYLPEGRRVVDKRQHHVIFSNVKEVREVSALFLEKLHSRQRESAVVRNISDIILEFAENHFDCYIRYCTNQVYQIREMQDMIANPSNVMFREYLRRLESDKCCQNLNIQSFLLLPMQRITRLPLLILAILNRTPLDHPVHDVVENTLRSVQKLVTACNDGARQMDRTEQLHEIHKKLDFAKLKPFPLVSASRQLERRGVLLRLQVEQKLLGKLRVKKKPLYLFIFTDYVIVTKRKKDTKGDYIYRVKDYASRAVVEVERLQTHTGVSFPKFGEQDPIAKATYAVSTASAEHAFLMLFLDSASRKEESYILLAQNDTDKTRWMECLMRPDQKDEEKIYQHWDCPQVQAVYDYKAQQPDELDLDRGDVVKVYRKMADGWYEGERLRDMQWGWFPSNFTQEIENAHTRARNLRQTHNLNCGKYNARIAMQL